MKLYAETAGLRMRQMLKDLLAVVWIVVWVWMGWFIHSLVDRLAAPGERIERAGGSFARAVGSLGSGVQDVPVIGEGLRRPFDVVAEAGTALEQAGQSQQDIVHSLALWLGILLAAIPIAVVLIAYVPGRWRWMREAGAAARIRLETSDLRLFAMRALANRPLHELRAAVRDPAGALESGDYGALADLELRELGLRA